MFASNVVLANWGGRRKERKRAAETSACLLGYFKLDTPGPTTLDNLSRRVLCGSAVMYHMTPIGPRPPWHYHYAEDKVSPSGPQTVDLGLIFNTRRVVLQQWFQVDYNKSKFTLRVILLTRTVRAMHNKYLYFSRSLKCPNVPSNGLDEPQRPETEIKIDCLFISLTLLNSTSIYQYPIPNPYHQHLETLRLAAHYQRAFPFINYSTRSVTKLWWCLQLVSMVLVDYNLQHVRGEIRAVCPTYNDWT